MLDARIRPYIDPPMDTVGRFVSRLGIQANFITLFGFFIGVGAIFLIANKQFLAGLVLILTNRLLDGLDGGVARAQGVTDFGGFLDIVCDFLIYAGVVFALAVAVPQHASWLAFLIFTFMGAGSSFLAYAILAERYGLSTKNQGEKSFYYISGLSEGAETIMALSLMCLIPSAIPIVACVYGILCLLTTFGRVLDARRAFL